jgi:diguanylate cyclase (GGDEF)-like protein
MPEKFFMQCNLQWGPCRSLYAKIIENSINGIIVFNGAGTVQLANRAAEQLLGEQPGGLLGKGGDFPWAEADGGEFAIRRKDGKFVNAEVRLVKMKWEGETAKVAYLRDISDRKCTEEALKTAILRLEAEKTKSEAIIAAIGDGISIQDTDFRILYQNKISKDLMGSHIGSHCYTAFAHRDAVCDDCPVAVSFRDGRIRTVERHVTLDTETMSFEITVSPLKDAQGKVIAGIEVVRNITERKRTEEILKFVSSHDILTGLYNRFYFEQEMVRLERSRHFPLSIVMADMDDLKALNDRMGHAAGDVLLRQAALLFREAFRGEDIVARIGGDEFAVLLPDTDEQAVQEIMARVRENLRIWNDAHGNTISLSLGVATARNGVELLEGMKTADLRMYEDKVARTGRPPRRSP